VRPTTEVPTAQSAVNGPCKFFFCIWLSHSDFVASVLALLQGASPTKVMSNANELASVVEQVLANCKVQLRPTQFLSCVTYFSCCRLLHLIGCACRA